MATQRASYVPRIRGQKVRLSGGLFFFRSKLGEKYSEISVPDPNYLNAATTRHCAGADKHTASKVSCHGPENSRTRDGPNMRRIT